MSEKEPTPAELFLERIELYHNLGNQILSSLEAYEGNPFDNEAPLEELRDMSETEFFRYKADKTYEGFMSWGPDIDKEYRYISRKFIDFKQRFSILYPSNPITKIFEHDRPVTHILDVGFLEELLKLLKEDPRFEEEDLDYVLQVMYLNEKGSLEVVKSVPEEERVRLSGEHLEKIFSSQVGLQVKLDDLITREVIAEMAANDTLEEIGIKYSEDSPKESHFKIVYRALYREDETLGQLIRVITTKIIVLVGGQLMVASKDNIAALTGARPYREKRPGEPEPISPDMQEFVLRSLKKAVIKLAKLSELTTDEVRQRLNFDLR